MHPTRSDLIAALAVAIALAALAFPAGSRHAVLIATTASVAILLAVGVVSARWIMPRARRRYELAVHRDKRRTAEALGHPLEKLRIGDTSTWVMPDGSEVTYVKTLAGYKDAVRRRRVDPQTSRAGMGPPIPPMPAGWLGRWQARRHAKRR